MKGAAHRTEILHRSVRVTLAASAGFYPFLYGFQSPVLALYALFAPIALGLLSSIPGSGRQRAEVMLKALPVGLVLVALGTVLAVATWAAVLGMLVVGFLLAFAAIAGPRPAGAAPGLQLFYILACFPPYEPQTLWLRLAGLAFGVVVLALCELFLLPQPPGPAYRKTLAEALVTAGDTVAGRIRLSPEALRAAGARLRLSETPPAERPAGPGRAVRGLSQAGSATRRLLELLAHLTETGELRELLQDDAGGRAPLDTASRSLLPSLASLCHETAAALRQGRPAPGPQRMDEVIDGFQRMRVRQVTGPATEVPPVSVLRRQAALLAVAESVRIVEISVRVALDGRRTPPIEPRELFWYTEASTPHLWVRRIIGNMTLRSVQFQNALRIALALAAARLVAGSLDLAHGFWVLLAVLTLSRTTVGATWAAIRQAVAGNLVGAVVAGALLIGLGRHTEAYAAILAPGMLFAFALGPLLGIAWAQGLFTLVVATAFAQIAPSSWRLAEERIVDVVTGSAIGLLCAMLAWPAGARREVRRTMAGLLRECGPLIQGTVAALTAVPPGSAAPPPTFPALHRLRLAESAYAQFRSEPAGGASVRADWHAVLIAANQILLGAHWLPRVDLPTSALPQDAADRARGDARALAETTDRLAALCAGARPQPDRTRSAPSRAAQPDGTPLPALVDLDEWLRSLTAQLTRVEARMPDLSGGARRGTTAAGTAGPGSGPGGHGS
ncbi:FUSC family protein [Streptomyces spinoverrucosus]|uniref:FUSC family protein n=1 Tax=Streptomyces spinoverrucosus TaxID=284043 RepID=A0A4Y3VBL6_9ACTN|nr:FUSC family protein [Streptomyces spinoverrucosus]GEC02376.1 FUSC family protein [Streptomyces spinoverrucosus]GHB43400.1 FUSC family protein [Streptomyces spinoverrucosus]